MKVVIYENPLSAVRMTYKSKFVDPAAKEYLQFKNGIAELLRLNLVASAIRSTPRIEMTNKFPIFDDEGEKILPLTATVNIKAKFYRGNKQRVDIDNLLKMLLDLLQTAKIIYNDDQVRKISAELYKDDPNPRFEFEISILQPMAIKPLSEVERVKV